MADNNVNVTGMPNVGEITSTQTANPRGNFTATTGTQGMHYTATSTAQHPMTMNAYATSATRAAEEAAIRVGARPTGSGPSFNSSYQQQKTVAPKMGRGINMGYIAGGIAAAGIAAAGIESRAKENKENGTAPGVLESVGSGIVGATDSVVNATNTVLGTVMQPMVMMPYMVASQASAMLTPRDQNTGALLKPVTMVQKAASRTNSLLNGSFSEYGAKISPTFGASVTKGFEKTANFASPVLDRVAKVPGLGGLSSQSIKEIPKNMAHQPAIMTGIQVAGTVGAAAGAAGSLTEVAHKLKALGEMQKALTGKEVSLPQLLFGKLEKPVELARSQLLKISGAHIAASFASLGMMLKMRSVDGLINKVLDKVHLGGGGIAGLAGLYLMNAAWTVPDKIAGVVEEGVGTPLLDVNTYLMQQEKIRKLTAKDYAEFIYDASPELQKYGEAGQALAMQMGAQHEAAGTPIVEVLRETYNGEQEKRLARTLEENKAAKEAAGLTQVNRLTQPAAIPKEVVGSFTQKEAKRMSDAALARMTAASPSLN